MAVQQQGWLPWAMAVDQRLAARATMRPGAQAQEECARAHMKSETVKKANTRTNKPSSGCRLQARHRLARLP